MNYDATFTQHHREGVVGRGGEWGGGGMKGETWREGVIGLYIHPSVAHMLLQKLGQATLYVHCTHIRPHFKFRQFSTTEQGEHWNTGNIGKRGTLGT